MNVYPQTDLEGSLSYKELAERISEFTLSIYRPSDYVVSEKGLQHLEEEKEARNFNQKDRERFLIAMIRTNFLKATGKLGLFPDPDAGTYHRQDRCASGKDRPL